MFLLLFCNCDLQIHSAASARFNCHAKIRGADKLRHTGWSEDGLIGRIAEGAEDEGPRGRPAGLTCFATARRATAAG
jgi:hypothetical protein